MSKLITEARTALGALRRRPGFSALAILTLAVGLGPTTAILSILTGVLLRPYPYADAERIVRVWSMNAPQSLFGRDLSYPDFLDFREYGGVFEAMAIADATRLELRLGDESQAVPGARVSADLLPLVGARPQVGRLFTAEDDTWGAQPVAIVSDELWRRQLAADPAVVGKPLTIGGVPHTLIGVLGARVKFPDEADLFVPLALAPDQARRDDRTHLTLARLSPGVGAPQAAAQLSEVAARLAADHPETNRDWDVWVMTLRESRVGRYREILVILAAVVAFVLLLACANVGNLLLQRANSAEREMAVRMAVGSGRWSLVRRFLFEVLILSVAGGLLSLLFAYWVLEAVVARLPFTLPSYMSFEFDPTVLGLLAAAVVTTALVAGLLPALRASKPSLVPSLKEAGAQSAGVPQRRMRNVLVGLQLALSLMLLMGAGLMIRSFSRLQNVDPGFRAERSFNFALELPEEADEGERQELHRRTLARVGALPGAEAVGAGSFVPMRGAFDTNVAVGGRALGPDEPSVGAGVQLIDGDYFEALGIRILKGRGPTPVELTAGDRVAVVNATMERRLWPQDGALGQQVRLTFGDDSEAGWTVVGVAADVRGQGLAREPGLEIYLPYAAQPQGAPSYFVRSTGESLDLAPAVRAAVREVDPRLAVALVQPMDEVLYWSVWQQRMVLYLLTLFAAVALVLAAVGVYASLSYSITARHREIGVRMAMGADVRRVVKMVLGEVGLLVAVALVVGVLGALLLGRLISGLLYGVSPWDPVTLVGIVVLLALVSAVSVLGPALRAGRLDPVFALRQE